VVSAIIVAAGSGERVKGKVEKQFLLLAGIPVVVYALKVFEETTSIDETLLVVPRGKAEWVEEEIVRRYGLAKVSRVLEGGARRQDSVYQGLAFLDRGIVAVHDGVRPFVSAALVDVLVKEAEQSGAAVPAVGISDTIKSVEEGMVRRTLTREGMWLAQTPQVFKYELLKSAYDKAYEENYLASDDSALVERLGYNVRIVEGSRRNIKITTEEDILLAEALLKGRGPR